MSDASDDSPVTVSVLMPVYNASRFVGEAIESVLGQSFRDFELLVLDDGSTDGSGAVVERYARTDPRIRLVARENRGITRTLNELAALARGGYLARMDADDVCLPDRFRSQIARLDAEPELSALGSYWMNMTEAADPIFVPSPPLDHEEIDASNLRGNVALNHPTVMMRKDAFDAVGGYDESNRGAEDLDLWLRLAERGRLANSSDIVLHYRIMESGISGSQHVAQMKAIRQACEAACARRGLPVGDIDDAHWRPGKDRASRLRFALQWGWQAWNTGNHATARRLFVQALKVAPCSPKAWKAVLFMARQDFGSRRNR